MDVMDLRLTRDSRAVVVRRLVVLVVVLLSMVGSVGVLSEPAAGQSTGQSGLCDTGEIAQFSDVQDSDYAAAYILCMRVLGLSQGRSDGDFGPDRELNRGQMASFLIRLWTEQLGEQCPTGVVIPFTDTAGTTHEANIECLFGLGITQGTSATTYGPGDPLKASQISRFLYRTYQKAGGDQCTGTGGSERDRAAECLVGLRVAPTTAEATSAAAVTRAQMGVYVIGLWHNLTGRGLPPVPPQLPSTTTTTPPVTSGPAVLDQAGIWVTDTDGTGAERVTPDLYRVESGFVIYDRAVSRPVWSPDSSRISYTYDIRRSGVWVVGADGAGANQVGPGGRDVRWSPDGSRIAYTDDRSGVWVVGADGAGANQVAPDGSRSWVWSPDGSRIAYTDDRSGVWVVGADGAGANQVAPDGSRSWVWSPDGSRIAYWTVDDDRNSTGVWVVGADGAGAVQVAPDGSSTWPGSWSPDGSRIAYWTVDDDRNSTGVWVVGADGTGAVQVAPGGRDVSWSPDGSRIAYWTVDDDRNSTGVWWVVGADGTGAVQVAPGGRDVSWSPDGSRIAYWTVDDDDWWKRRVWVVGADGTDNKQVSAHYYVFEWSWSPDGSRIAYVGRDDRVGYDVVGVVSADGASRQVVATTTNGALTQWDVVWSPDGSRIAYAVNVDTQV